MGATWWYLGQKVRTLRLCSVAVSSVCNGKQGVADNWMFHIHVVVWFTPLYFKRKITFFLHFHPNRTMKCIGRRSTYIKFESLLHIGRFALGNRWCDQTWTMVYKYWELDGWLTAWQHLCCYYSKLAKFPNNNCYLQNNLSAQVRDSSRAPTSGPRWVTPLISSARHSENCSIWWQLRWHPKSDSAGRMTAQKFLTALTLSISMYSSDDIRLGYM